MNNQNLPAEVVERDRKLQRSADELMELRWHWTLDESNPDRVSHSEYARQVGVDRKRVSVDANAWAEWLTMQNRAGTGPIPGAPQNAQDIRELKRIGETRAEAAKAIAAATGTTVSNVARNKRDEIDTVIAQAAERAERKGTMPEAEIDDAARWRAATHRAARDQQDRRKAARSLTVISIEGKVASMIAKGNEIIKLSEGVEFNDDEREALTDAIGRLRSLLNMLDMRIAGTVDVDWDTEFQKITK